MEKQISTSWGKIIRVIVAIFFVVLALCCFLPLFRKHLEIGMSFGFLFSLSGAALALLWGKFKKGVWRKLYVFLAVGFGMLLIWFIFLAIQILGFKTSIPPKNTTVMVLGARVFEGGPSKSLRSRLDTAYNYLQLNPDSKVVVTGGQGDDEPETEALVQKNYLIEKGIDEDRIILEDSSTSTFENFAYSKELLLAENLPLEVVVVTQSYHKFRADRIGKTAGYITYSLEAYTDPFMFPDYFGRELLALTKFYLYSFIGKYD